MNGDYLLVEFLNGRKVAESIFQAPSLSVAKRKARRHMVHVQAYGEVWNAGKLVLCKTESRYSSFKETR